nr:GMC oxidoreductase [Rhodococcus sp. NCIMB 12038]
MSPTESEYEFVIVGSGAGGGPLAANLAAAGHRVLLLEAGDDHSCVYYEAPIFHAQASEDEDMRWDYFVRHYRDDHAQAEDPKHTPDRAGVLYPPDICFTYFAEGTDDDGGEDLAAVVDGVEFARTLSARLRGFVTHEVLPGPNVRTREEIGNYIRQQAWGHHASCSCKIGADDDPMAVLDGRFRYAVSRDSALSTHRYFPESPASSSPRRCGWCRRRHPTPFWPSTPDSRVARPSTPTAIISDLRERRRTTCQNRIESW